MSLADADALVASPSAATLKRRPLRKRAVQLLRRGHLYLGLFLFPWAVLYGVTAFLFNHPTAFAEQPTTGFGRDVLAGTPLETPPAPGELAQAVVDRLNELHRPEVPYVLVGEARYARDSATASVRGGGRTISVAFDLKSGGGTARVAPAREPTPVERPPFAVGPDAKPEGRGNRGGRGEGGKAEGGRGEGVKLPDPLPERIKASVPAVLSRLGLPAGEVSVTAVPDLVFAIEANGKTWATTYNPLTGAVSGGSAAKPEELGWRRFLLRLHTAHGYPAAATGRWFWALVVDAMAFTMCFWALTGVVMWWQIKATRRAGLVVMLLSAVAATALGFAMHAAMTS